jgi:RNA polymerase sigma-70 factor (ECF subfamily)
MTDASIVERVLRGEIDAFGMIVARYHGRCWRYARRVLRDDAEADDVVQDAFIRAYDALGRYREQDRFGAWLFRILVTECRAALSRRSRRARTLVPVAVGSGERYDAAAPAHDDALRDVVEGAIARLDPMLREAFLLRHLEGMSYEEMHMVTGVGVSALKMRVKRACEALRAFLEGQL